MTKYVGLFEIKLTPKTKKWNKKAWFFVGRADQIMLVSDKIKTAEDFARHHLRLYPERYVYVEVEV